MKSIFSLPLALVLAATLAAPARVLASPQGQGLPAGIERVAEVEGVTEYRLQNGLRVLLFPDPTKQTITVNITYLVGSRHENYGETGMAHLLEHLVFKGTPRHPNIPQELTEHGARPNGTTSFDRTNYFETFAATDENLAWALDLEADRMVNSFIAKKDLDSEMTVVRNEFERGENNPFRVLYQRTLSTAYVWHNYGKSTIGARSDIENVPIDRLQAFYKKYYQPDNAILMVAGKFEPARALQLVAEKFGPIPRPERPLPQIYTLDPVQDGERMVTVRRVGDTQLMMAAYHVPAGSHPDFAAIDVLAFVLGDTPAGRLHKALVETKKAASAGAFGAQQHDPGVLLVTASLRKEMPLDAARETLLQTVEELTKTPPTAEEVDRAKTALLKDIDLTLTDPNRVGLGLSEWMAMGDWRLFFLHRDRIKAVTPADVQRVASTYLKPSNRTLGLFIPEEKPDRAEIPETPDVAALVKDYKGGEAVAAGEAFDPSPANITSRSTTAEAGGLEMTFLPKETRGDTVVASLALRFGDEKSLAGRLTAGGFAGQMLMRGTTKHTRQQIQDEIDRLKARVSVSGGPTQASAYIETTRENLPAVMRLVAEILREPAFPEAEFEQLKQQALVGIESSRSEPNAIAQNEFSRIVNPFPKGDVRYVETFDEQIEQIKATTLDDVKKFYKDFYGASNGQLAVVGDFDPRQIQPLANELLGSWKSPRPYARIETPYVEVKAVDKSFETPDKENAFFIAGLVAPIRDDDPDYPALVLGNYMLGGGFLNSRLATRIRQKEGISYSVGSGFSAGALDKRGSFTAFAIYAPQNLPRLEAAFREELERARKEGFTAEEVAAAKSGLLQARQVSRANDPELVRTLANYLFLDRTMQWDAAFEQKLQALTPDQVVAAMRRHIDPSKLVVIKAGDFANKGATAAAAAQ